MGLAVFVRLSLRLKERETKREVLRPQHFHKKLYVVSYYWFKFESAIEITFLAQQRRKIDTINVCP